MKNTVEVDDVVDRITQRIYRYLAGEMDSFSIDEMKHPIAEEMSRMLDRARKR